MFEKRWLKPKSFEKPEFENICKMNKCINSGKEINRKSGERK